MIIVQEFFKVYKSSSPDAPTLLFVAGWESALSMMKDLIEKFKSIAHLIVCKSFENLQVDSSESVLSNRYLHEYATDRLESFIKNNHIEKLDSIIVHSSLGCLTGLEIIKRKLVSVRSFVVMNGTNHYLENDIQRIFWNQIPLNLRQNASQWIYDKKKIEEVIARILPLLSKNPVIIDMLKSLPENEIIPRIIRNIERIQKIKDATFLTIPVIIIGGELDEVIPRGFLRELNKEIKGSELIFIPAANFDGPKLLGVSYYIVIRNFFQKHKIM